MKSIVNERRLRFGRFIGTTTSIAGFIMLITATVFTLSPSIAASSLPLLIMGIVFAITGLRYSNRWVRQPVAHEALESALKGLGKEAVLLSYWKLADHILITKNGVHTFVTRNTPFNLTVNNDRWQHHEPFTKRLTRALTQNGLGNPVREADKQTARVKRKLKDKFPDLDVSVTPLVVFLSPNTFLDVQAQPEVPFVYSDKRTPALKSYLRQASGTLLSAEQIEQLREALQH